MTGLKSCKTKVSQLWKGFNRMNRLGTLKWSVNNSPLRIFVTLNLLTDKMGGLVAYGPKHPNTFSVLNTIFRARTD